MSEATTSAASATSASRKLPDPVTLTEAAAKRLRDIVATSGAGVTGVRLSLSVKGCSGQKYQMDVAKAASPGDIVVRQHDACLYIDPKAELYVLGMAIDFRSDKLQSGFVFENPNETGRCGCGESVTFSPH